MSPVFEKRKLKIETLGEYLTKVRKDLGLSIERVVEHTGICLKYMEALEKGDYKELPADVYVIGFLRELGLAYQMDAEVLVNQYKKERPIADGSANQKPLIATSKFKEFFSGLVITPKFLTIAGVVAVVSITGGYVAWQISALNSPPSLAIFEPSADTMVANASVLVKGQTEPGAQLTINGQTVLVEREGKFEATVGLTSGKASIEVVAKNKFDKQSSQIIPLIVSLPNTADRKPVVLDLTFSKDTNLKLRLDDGDLKEESVVSGSTKRVQANQKIAIGSSDAGAVRISLNGNDLGLLGQEGQQLDNVSFTADSIHVTPSLSPK